MGPGHCRVAGSGPGGWPEQEQARLSKGRGIEIIKRWFADEDHQGETELAVIAAKLNAGFKKLAAAMRKGAVILTDVPEVRGDTASTIWLSEAAAAPGSAATDRIRVVYIESAFCADQNVLSGKKNWTRILVHEMSHVELGTDDHRYAHNALGMKPDKHNLSTATCLDNAESWAFFAADCAGNLDDGIRGTVLKAISVKKHTAWLVFSPAFCVAAAGA
ncbi:M35 family metallo-endopeptidase [Thiohalocapsa sp. ML1]|uniref:M35 family metallo-endopeptidase n=1 Tax=Thiohalocapsa sp. ML1 TaxID=1431688 RepID=UPI00073227A9|nr:M35 family metallo-endopeptidase [Thiohalocapsa sp. ML1]